VQKVTTITNNIIKKALLIILPCVVLTTTFASARQRNVIFFNGMNSKKWEAKRDMKTLKILFSERFPKIARNLTWHLAYTRTNGLFEDSKNILYARKDLLYYERHKMSYCWMNDYAYGCNEGTENVQEYKDVKLSVLYDGYPYTSGHFEHNDDIIIAYSRGNIFANVMQTYARGRSVKRINIASPDIEKYGYLYNLKNDLVVVNVVGNRATMKANYYPHLTNLAKYWYDHGNYAFVGKQNSNFIGDYKGHSFKDAYLHIWGSRWRILDSIYYAYNGFENLPAYYWHKRCRK